MSFSDGNIRHSFLKERFQQSEYSLTIQDFTRKGMIIHVRQRLRQNKKFKVLKNHDTLFKEIVTIVADHAQGVWL